MKKVKLQLNKSQWEALMLIIRTEYRNYGKNLIEDMAIQEQLQKLFLRLANRLPTVTNPYYKKKYFALSITLSEAWALYCIAYLYIEGYNRIVIDFIRFEINQQIA